MVKCNERAESDISGVLGGVTGIRSIAVNGTTGSCLIHYDPSVVCRDDIVTALSREGYFDTREAITNDDYMKAVAAKVLSLLFIFL